MDKLHFTLILVLGCMLSFAYGATHPVIIGNPSIIAGSEPDNGYGLMLARAQQDDGDSFAVLKKGKR